MDDWIARKDLIEARRLKALSRRSDLLGWEPDAEPARRLGAHGLCHPRAVGKLVGGAAVPAPGRRPLGLLLRGPARARALDGLPQPVPQRRLRPPGELPPLLCPQLSALLPFRPSPPHKGRRSRSGAPGPEAVDAHGLSEFHGRFGPLDRPDPRHHRPRPGPLARALPQGEGAAHRHPRSAALPARLCGGHRALGLLRELGGADLRVGADADRHALLPLLCGGRASRPAQRAGRDRKHAHHPARARSCAG